MCCNMRGASFPGLLRPSTAQPKVTVFAFDRDGAFTLEAEGHAGALHLP